MTNRESWGLRLAGAYNLVWGAWVVLLPLSLFNALELQHPIYPQIWQCVGMIVGVYGIGYFIAARNPVRHWPIILVGLLGKVLGPIGFLHAALTGALPVSFFIVIIFNDLVWWPLFFKWLRLAYRENHEHSSKLEKR